MLERIGSAGHAGKLCRRQGPLIDPNIVQITDEQLVIRLRTVEFNGLRPRAHETVA